MWTRNEYENAGNKIGQDFVAKGGEVSINDLATKVAAEGKLTPEGIRTVVRLANVSAFENLFSKSAGDKSSDRMLEFEVGDPEIVINKLHKTAAEKHTVKVAEDYNRNLDYFGDVEQDVVPLEKTASAVPGVELEKTAAPTISKAHARLQFKRANDRMREQALQAKAYWTENLEKAAQCMRALDCRVSARALFEKHAVAALGGEIVPELFQLRCLTSPGTPIPDAVCGGEKIASVINSHIADPSKEQVPILALIKEASEARSFYLKCKAGCEWIANNMEKVN
jgi:hypothetical protein